MFDEIPAIVGTLLGVAAAILLLRVLIDLVVDGTDKIHLLQQSGVGVIGWLRGEVNSGNASPRSSVTIQDGMHAHVRKGKIHFRRKSTVTTDVL